MLQVMKRVFLGVMLAEVVATGAMAQTTAEVWDHHVKAWLAQDADAIAADYTEDSLLIINGEVFKGTEAIKQTFTRLFQIFRDGANTINPALVLDRIVYITWQFTPTGANKFLGTDTFIIENGKIAIQTVGSPLFLTNPLNLR